MIRYRIPTLYHCISARSFRVRTLEPHLAGCEFLGAVRFTAADVSVGYALMLAELLGLNERFTPAVSTYWQRLKVRPAFERALLTQTNPATGHGVSPRPATMRSAMVRFITTRTTS